MMSELFLLQEEHCTSLVYQLPGDGLHLSSVYDTMEDARQNLDIKVHAGQLDIYFSILSVCRSHMFTCPCVFFRITV